jgi:hypothetical protein
MLQVITDMVSYEVTVRQGREYAVALAHELCGGPADLMDAVLPDLGVRVRVWGG